MMNPVIEIKGVKKSFGAVAALKASISTSIAGGPCHRRRQWGRQVHSHQVLSGVYTIDEGSILIDGHPVSIKSPKDAKRFGIETVYRDLALCDNLDISSNVFLGREITKTIIPGLLKVFDHNADARTHTRGAQRSAHQQSRDSDKPGPPSIGRPAPVGRVAKSVCFDARVIIMDEPTAALGVTQTRLVLDLARRLSERGCCVIYISHIMRDVLETADRIAVMKSGQVVGLRKAAETDSDELVFMMISGENRKSRQ
jgi:D-xylose transport system ATP-binding protein